MSENWFMGGNPHIFGIRSVLWIESEHSLCSPSFYGHCVRPQMAFSLLGCQHSKVGAISNFFIISYVKLKTFNFHD